MKLQEQLSKTAFWDTDLQKMDVEKHAGQIIAKVFEYGRWNDIKAVMRYYGAERVKQVLLSSPFFFPDTINFICTVFDLKPQQLACYKNRPYQPNVYKLSGD